MYKYIQSRLQYIRLITWFFAGLALGSTHYIGCLVALFVALFFHLVQVAHRFKFGQKDRQKSLTTTTLAHCRM